MVVGPTVKRFSGMRTRKRRKEERHDLKNESVLGNKFSVCPHFLRQDRSSNLEKIGYRFGDTLCDIIHPNLDMIGLKRKLNQVCHDSS